MKRPYRLFTSEEKRIIRTSYPNTDVNKIAKLIGRSSAQVYNMATRMKVRKAFIIPKLVLTDAEKGYIAGIIDGEGTISIHRRGDYTGSLQAYISVSNTDSKLTQWLYDKLGGYQWLCTNNSVKRKKSYLWATQKIELCFAVINEILPYLVIKKRQAELLLEFLQVRLNKLIKSKYGQVEWKIFNEIISLNKKGPRADLENLVALGDPDAKLT